MAIDETARGAEVTPPPAPIADMDLVRRLQDGDEGAFAALVERFHAPMVRVARSYVPSAAVAEEVVQDAWLGVIKGLARFQGRASLKTWIFRIVVNRAISQGGRERRQVPMSALGRAGDDGPAVDPDRFDGRGRWSRPPERWSRDDPERTYLAAESLEVVGRALDALPERQRTVVVLRDVEGLSARDVQHVMGVSEVNQRVLLHRGRARVRAALEAHLRKG